MENLRFQCYRRSREPLTERHVQAIWYDRAMRPSNLVTRTGETLRVIHPGDWNLGAGPDFRNAVLEVGPDRRRLRGDVEIHLHPSDWTAHGHGGDPAYRNVVVHVTWSCGPDPVTLPKGAVSVWLGRFLTPQVGFAPEQIDLGAYPFARLPSEDRPCHGRLAADPDLAGMVLAEAGAYRLETKARRIRQLLSSGRERRTEVFYREVMNALGYKRNSPGFRQVAERVPYALVRSEPQNARSALLAAASFVEWDRGAVRPRNAPEVRLSAAAEIFTATRIMDLLDVADFSDASCREMIGLMTEGRRMGRGRAGAVLANVILPFALAEGRVRQSPRWLPPEDPSEPMRLTAFRMFGRDHNPRAWYLHNGLKMQGLIQIHRDFCLQVHPDCLNCQLIEELGKEMR